MITDPCNHNKNLTKEEWAIIAENMGEKYPIHFRAARDTEFFFLKKILSRRNTKLKTVLIIKESVALICIPMSQEKSSKQNLIRMGALNGQP